MNEHLSQSEIEELKRQNQLPSWAKNQLYLLETNAKLSEMFLKETNQAIKSHSQGGG